MLTVTTNSSARTGPHSRVLPQWGNGQMGEWAKGLRGWRGAQPPKIFAQSTPWIRSKSVGCTARLFGQNLCLATVPTGVTVPSEDVMGLCGSLVPHRIWRQSCG